MLHSWTESDFEGFTQNGCYGNQSQPLELLFDSTDASNPCPFTKQDLIFKQAYLVGFCFVLFNKLKFWQLVLVFSVLYRLYLEITLFCTKPSEQIVYCHVTDIKMLKKLVYWIACENSRPSSLPAQSGVSCEGRLRFTSENSILMT